MFDIVGKRRWFFLFSALITIPGIIFIILTPLTEGRIGLNFSIDYTGGTIWEVHFAQGAPDAGDVRQVLVDAGLEGPQVSITDGPKGQYVLMRMPPIGLIEAAPSLSAAPSSEPSASAGASGSPGPSPSAAPSPEPSASAAPAASGIALPTDGTPGEIATALQAAFGPIDDVTQATVVGPIVSRDLINQALILILAGSLAIVAWITVRFRDVRMGFTALVALLHDVLVVVGAFAILGTFFRVQIDALFVTAMLTVIGFSVHDTIVVFDRIRENRYRHAGEPFSAIVNHSLLQTLGRSINTSMTVVITLTALLLFGGEAIRWFVLALLIGIVSGTFSSIFNASPLLVVWHERDDRRRQAQLTAARASR
ncbi:MAG: protein translocase subunit SecF [Candidatus Limnocylindrales bacterium]